MDVVADNLEKYRRRYLGRMSRASILRTKADELRYLADEWDREAHNLEIEAKWLGEKIAQIDGCQDSPQ